MADLAERHDQAKRLKYAVESQLHRLQEGLGTDALRNACARDLNELLRRVEELEAAPLPAAGERRELWRTRIADIRVTADGLRGEMAHHMTTQHQRSQEEAERRELLNGTHSVVVDLAIKEGDSLKKSSRAMDEMLGLGEAVMSSLRDQRTRLKGAHRRALEIANTLGLSNSLMRVIQRRTTGDKILVYCGMLIIMFLLYMAYRYTRAAAT